MDLLNSELKKKRTSKLLKRQNKMPKLGVEKEAAPLRTAHSPSQIVASILGMNE
jgi:hypothetical protein